MSLNVTINGKSVDTKRINLTRDMSGDSSVDMEIEEMPSTGASVVVNHPATGSTLFNGTVTGWSSVSSGTSASTLFTVMARSPRMFTSSGTFLTSGGWTLVPERWLPGKSDEVIAALDEALDELLGMADRKKPIWKRGHRVAARP